MGRVVRKPVSNTNPELNVNPSIMNFFLYKKVFTGYLLGTLKLFKIQTEGKS